jgi:hypothetical protein
MELPADHPKSEIPEFMHMFKEMIGIDPKAKKVN